MDQPTKRTIGAILGQQRVLPLITIDGVGQAAPLAEVLSSVGATVSEVALRTPAALDAIAAMVKCRPDLTIGAGTVRSAAQAEQAVAAGAQFLVSPGDSAEVRGWAEANRTPFLPGAVTATEILACAANGYPIVKFFPAEAAGGVATLAALSDPFPELSFVPTGGINADNIATYLALDQVLCCGGSWTTSRAMIADGRFDEIGRLLTEALRAPRSL